MSIFFTGCTHFGHANIIKLTNRPFVSVEQMDEALIHYWNETVKPEDTVYHVGDFAYRGAPGETYLKRLNGNIVCIRGNHDPDEWGNPYLEFKHNKRLWCLFHYPIEEWNGWYRGAVHIHAHTHKKEVDSAERRFNVGVDACAFRPVSIDELEARL